MPEPGGKPLVLLVYAYAPPTRGGTAVVLHRLFSGLEGHRLEVITDRALKGAVSSGGELVLEGRYHWFARLRPGRMAALPLAAEVIELLNVPLALLAGMRAGLLARAEGAERILTALDGGFSNIAAGVAARISGKPRTVLVFDLWQENAYRAVERRLARALERRLLRGADSVVVFCEEAADHIRQKHGVECHVLPIPIVPDPGPSGPPPTPGEPDPAAAGPRPSPGAPALAAAGRPPSPTREILVAGAIYWAQEDAVRRLLRATRDIPDAAATILGDEGSLRARGLVADRYEPPLPAAEFPARLARADVLFLGLSHGSAHPEVIRTATPARLVEYMASGRPLLVHAPRGAHAAEYARAHDFATVVDVPDDAALARGLRDVLDDPARAAARARRARALALERHDVAEGRRRFERMLG